MGEERDEGTEGKRDRGTAREEEGGCCRAVCDVVGSESVWTRAGSERLRRECEGPTNRKQDTNKHLIWTFCARNVGSYL